MTGQKHNKYIAIAFLANGTFQLVIVTAMLALMSIVLAIDDLGKGDFPTEFFALLLGFVFVVNLVFLSPNFVAAYAIWKKKPWARVAGIVAAAMAAMNIPLGTLAAIYSFWFFCGEQWKEVYPDAAGSTDRNFLESPQEGYENFVKSEDGAYVYRTPEPPDWR